MTSKKKLKRRLRRLEIRVRWFKNYAAHWQDRARAHLDECQDVYRDLADYMLFVRPEPATRADDDRLQAALENDDDQWLVEREDYQVGPL